MRFEDYLVLRNGRDCRGGVKNAISYKERDYLSIVQTKGWPKIYGDLELDESDVTNLLEMAQDSKEKSGRAVKREDRTNKDRGRPEKYLYLLRNEHGKHKIGISVDPIKRAKALQSASGFVTKVLRFWDVGPVFVGEEKNVIHSLRKYRTIGEWFDFPKESDPISLVEGCMLSDFKVIG